MPTAKSKRVVALQSSFSPSNLVADLNITMDANFAYPTNVQAANVTEDTSVTGTEATEYQMTFSLATGPLGVITMSFNGEGEDLASGVSVAKTAATTTTRPTATTGTVTPIVSPSAQYLRVWQQSALDGANELVDQTSDLDVRVSATSPYTVTQTVTSTAEAELVLTYAWKDVNGATVISGTVKLQASSTAHGTYTLGAVTVTDNPAQLASDPTGGGGGKKAMRERLKALMKELRRLRKEKKHR